MWVTNVAVSHGTFGPYVSNNSSYQAYKGESLYMNSSSNPFDLVDDNPGDSS